MIDFLPNSTATIYLKLDDDGAPVLNAVILVTVTDPTGTEIVTNGPALEVGDGFYSYSLTYLQTAELGTYFVLWHVTTPSESQHSTVYTIGYEAAYPVTLLELRHDVSKLVEGTEGFVTGKIVSETSTAGPPAVETIIDYGRMESDNAIRGWKFFVYSGVGAGYSGRVTSSSASTFSFTVSPINVGTDGSTPTTDSYYEIHRHFSAQDIDDYIRMAVLEVQDTCLVPISYVYASLSYPTLEYAIPSGFSHIHGIDIEVSDGQWVEVVPACWKVVRSVRKVKLDGNVVAGYSGLRLRMRGFRPPQVPLLDDQGVDVRPSFVRYRAAAAACESKTLGRASDPEGFGQKMQLFESRAEAERLRIARRLPPNTRRID